MRSEDSDHEQFVVSIGSLELAGDRGDVLDELLFQHAITAGEILTDVEPALCGVEDVEHSVADFSLLGGDAFHERDDLGGQSLLGDPRGSGHALSDAFDPLCGCVECVRRCVSRKVEIWLELGHDLELGVEGQSIEVFVGDRGRHDARGICTEVAAGGLVAVHQLARSTDIDHRSVGLCGVEKRAVGALCL